MSEKKSVLAGFREFLMRGNVVELAVAVVIGAAFTKIVTAVVDGVINPVVGSVGATELDRYQFCLQGPCTFNGAGEAVGGITIKWGAVLSASLTFLITAAVVYFLMIVPMNRFRERLDARKAAEESAAPAAVTEVELLTEIRDALVARRDGDGEAHLAAPTAQGGASDALSKGTGGV